MNKFFGILAAAFSLTLSLSSISYAYSVSYDQKVLVDTKEVAQIKVLVKDEQIRAESNFGGLNTIMLRNAAGTYSYLPEQKMATKIPEEMNRPNLTQDLPKFMEFLTANGGEKIGSEVYSEKQCDIYKFTEPTLKKEAKAWIWAEKQFPVKIEVAAPEGLTVVELNNIQFDPPTDDTSFQLPADVKVVSLEAATGGQAPAAPAEAQNQNAETAAPAPAAPAAAN